MKLSEFICISLFFTCSVYITNCTHETVIEPLPELVWNIENGYRWADLPVDDTGQVGFEPIPSSLTGITFSNTLTDDQIAENRVLLNGSGVTAGDITGNGYIDLYFTSLSGPNKLYQNLGDFRFKDITDFAGVAHEQHLSTGAVFADINGNGRLDLLVTSLNKKNTLYLNNGDSTFTRNDESGLGVSNGSSTMALADISGNGFPDLYITNYKKQSPRDKFDFQSIRQNEFMVNDSLLPPYDEYYTIIDQGNSQSELREIGEKDEFYLNNGNGTFSRIDDPENYFLSETGAPLGFYPDWGLTAKFQDLNGNGHQDLYVANDFWTPDRIWINQGDGTFHALDTLAIRNSSYSSMAVDFSDINRNGLTDIFVVEMLSNEHQLRMRQMNPDEPISLAIGEYVNRPRYNRNSLFYNQGDQSFAEIAYYSGLQSSDWSWATRFLDINLNGYEDLIINTGFMYDLQDMDAQQQVSEDVADGVFSFDRYILGFPPLHQQNKIFQNNGDLTFTEVSTEWGFDTEDISHGMVIADLDNDGDMDVVTNRMNEQAAVFRNGAPLPRIAVRLIGEMPNSQAIGANVTLRGGPVERQDKQLTSGGDYLSGSDPLIVFAADGENPAHSLLISWPDGRKSRLDSLKANRIYEIHEADMDKFERSEPSEHVKSPIFRNITDRLSHTHHEDPFDDFRIQPLLPYRLSQMGPGVAWIDLTGDGHEELLIGSGKGGRLASYRFTREEGVEKVDMGQLEELSPGDQTGIVGWKDNNMTHIVIGLANYEIGKNQAPSALHVQLEKGMIIHTDLLPGIPSTTGPVAASDYTGDGVMDLFVGGRFVPGEYPRDATSRLFRNDAGRLVDDTGNNLLLEDLGLVTGAVFVDLNLNGQQDLIVSTEWGTLRVFENDKGKFTERTTELGLSGYSGWWQGIATGDFTGNGYPDLVVSNLGRNSPYQLTSQGNPLMLFYDDLTGNRSVDLLDTYYDRSVGGYVPRRQFQEYASIQHRFGNIRTHRLFGRSTVEDLLGQDPGKLPHKEINTLEHMVFLNQKGEGFEVKPLPAEAQFTAGFYVGVADMDNDGYEDIFLSQNFFAFPYPQQKPRIDGGRGLWLKGDGTGGFDAVAGYESGVQVYGEQRGAGLADFTGDGRVDLVVSQNAAQTCVFENKTERRGVRVTLSGPQVNQTAIGAVVRLVYENGSKGPSRSIQAGSGYWSQNSVVQVLGVSGRPVAIEVRWPDGTLQETPFEENQMDYVIRFPNP